MTPNATLQAEAIPPDVLAQIVRQAIEERMDMRLYRATLMQEDAERGQIVVRDSSIMDET